MKIIFLSAVLIASLAAPAAFGQAELLLGASGAALGEVLSKGSSSTAVRVASVAGGAIVGAVIGDAFEKHEASKDARQRFHDVQLGRYEEAWIRAQTDWYYSTLDRKTGLPPAYNGAWGMFIGLAPIEKDLVLKKEQLPPQTVPAGRDAYINYLLQSVSADAAADNANSDTIQVPSVTATMPEHTANGITYQARAQEFPQLP